MASNGITLTKKPTTIYDGFNQANTIAGYYDMRSNFKNYILFHFSNQEGTSSWGQSSSLIYNGATNKEEFQLSLTIYMDFEAVFAHDVSLS